MRGKIQAKHEVTYWAQEQLLLQIGARSCRALSVHVYQLQVFCQMCDGLSHVCSEEACKDLSLASTKSRDEKLLTHTLAQYLNKIRYSRTKRHSIR